MIVFYSSTTGLAFSRDFGITVMGWTAPTLGIESAMMVVVETHHQRSAVHGQDWSAPLK
jgi:hypothetical protein